MKWGGTFSCCLWCGTVEVPYKSNGLCKKCYYTFYNLDYERKHNALCSLCNEIKPISTKKNNKIICKGCYGKYFLKLKKRKCYFCGNIGRIDKKNDGFEMCSSCYIKNYPRPKRLCFLCDKFEESFLKEGDKFICAYCYRRIHPKKKSKCIKCKKVSIISKIFKEGPYCHACYKKRRRIHYNALNYIRESRKLGNGGNITEKEIDIVFERDKVCIYCKSKEQLTLDHLIPISKGGKSDFSNFVLACKKCNISKRDTDVLIWCRRQNRVVPEIVYNLLSLQNELKRTEGETFAKSVELPSLAVRQSVHRLVS